MLINNFRKKLICWGAGDQALVLQPIIEKLGARYDVLVDDTSNYTFPFRHKCEKLNGVDEFNKWYKGRSLADYSFIIAIGNPYGHIRCKLHDFLVARGAMPVNVCDTSALLDKNITLGEGVQIMKGVVVNAHAKIGNQVILNTRCIVEHHDVLADGVEVGPGATLCGRVSIGNYSWIGAGATVMPRIFIDENSIIGAAALVRTNVPKNSVFAGVPAKRISHKES